MLFQPQLRAALLLTTWLWASYETSLGASFLVFKTKLPLLQPHKACEYDPLSQQIWIEHPLCTWSVDLGYGMNQSPCFRELPLS